MKRVCVAWAKCATISPHSQLSFPDAKLVEDGVEQVFRRRFAAPAAQELSRIKRSSVEKRRRAAALQDAGAKFL